MKIKEQRDKENLRDIHTLPLKRIDSVPSLQEKRAARLLFDLTTQTVQNILERNLIAIAISAPDGLDHILPAKKESQDGSPTDAAIEIRD